MEAKKTSSIKKTKVCRKCLVEKDIEEFSVNRRSSDGKQNKCKACNHAYNTSPERRKKNTEYHKEYRKNNQNRILENQRRNKKRYLALVQSGKVEAVPPDTILECSSCGVKLPAEQGFYRDYSVKRQYSHRCKKCVQDYNRENERRRIAGDYDRRFADKKKKLSPLFKDYIPGHYYLVEYTIEGVDTPSYAVTNNVSERIRRLQQDKGIKITSHEVIKTSKNKNDLLDEKRKKRGFL